MTLPRRNTKHFDKQIPVDLDDSWDETLENLRVPFYYPNGTSHSGKVKTVKITRGDILEVIKSETIHKESRDLSCKLLDGRLLYVHCTWGYKWKAEHAYGWKTTGFCLEPPESETPHDVIDDNTLSNESLVVAIRNLHHFDKSPRGVIYFIQMNNDDRLIKIGFTKHIHQRWYGLKTTDNPYTLTILGQCVGNIAGERMIHRLLKSSHFRGEWFHPTDRTLDLIRRLRGQNLFDIKELGQDEQGKFKRPAAIRSYAEKPETEYGEEEKDSAENKKKTKELMLSVLEKWKTNKVS